MNLHSNRKIRDKLVRGPGHFIRLRYICDFSSLPFVPSPFLSVQSSPKRSEKVRRGSKPYGGHLLESTPTVTG